MLLFQETNVTQMVINPPLDPRRYKLVQHAPMGHTFPLRHLRILRGLHLPPKGHRGPIPSRRRLAILPLYHCRPACIHGGVHLRRVGNEQPLQTSHPRISQGLWHPSYVDLLYGVCAYWEDAGCQARGLADESRFSAHKWSELACQLLGLECWGDLHCSSFCDSPHDPLLVRSQRYI